MLLVLASVPSLARAQDGTFTRILPGLPAAAQQSFEAGLEEFLRIRVGDDGFGPEFNGISCGACHFLPSPGGHGPDYLSNFYVGRAISDSRSRPVAGADSTFVHLKVRWGLHLPVPAGGNAISRRVPTSGLGAGLIAAIPRKALLARHDPGDRNGDGISGRASFTGKGIGRFGSQGQRASVRAFVDEAALLELGLESSDLGAARERIVDFLTLLAPPPRNTAADTGLGGAVFDEIGCGDCHVRTHVLERAPYRTADGVDVDLSVRSRKIHPYSDFLLHDMGPELDDGIALGDARSFEYRTTPLWGLRLRSRFLHDGRAPDLVWAIRLHGGEAAAARDAFLALDREAWNHLEAFLESL